MKRLASSILLCCLGRLGFAQEAAQYGNYPESQKRFSSIEVLIGAGIVKLRQGPPDPHHQDVGYFGYTFGLGKKYALTDRCQIEARILYERKGGKGLDDEQTGDTITHTNIIHKGAIETIDFYNCFTVPINLCYYFGHKVKFQVKAGPYFSYLLKATYVTKSSVSPLLHYSDDVTNQLRNDFGYSLGFGIETPLTKENRLSIQLISNWGLVNIAKPVNPAYPPNWKTNSLFIMIGFPLKVLKK